MSSKMRINSSVENPTVSKKHKVKKKKEKKDKNKTKHMPNSDSPYSFLEVPFTQKEPKRKKKEKRKNKSDEDIQRPKVQKHLHQILSTPKPIIHTSPKQIKNKHHKNIKNSRKIKKRVIFNLPNEQEQINDDTFAMNQFVTECSLESIMAEDMSSQDMFITQRSFLDPLVEISSSLSDDQTITTKTPDKSSCKSTSEAATQTENFFTFPALSTSFRFRQQQNTSKWEEEPMDLSLPNRTRQRQPTASSTNAIKISDTSSEEGETASKSKGSLSQLKVIQTRLNESFYFRVKGEDSPKPLCPLMKLTENVEKKAKK